MNSDAKNRCSHRSRSIIRTCVTLYARLVWQCHLEKPIARASARLCSSFNGHSPTNGRESSNCFANPFAGAFLATTPRRCSPKPGYTGQLPLAAAVCSRMRSCRQFLGNRRCNVRTSPHRPVAPMAGNITHPTGDLTIRVCSPRLLPVRRSRTRSWKR